MAVESKNSSTASGSRIQKTVLLPVAVETKKRFYCHSKNSSTATSTATTMNNSRIEVAVEMAVEVAVEMAVEFHYIR